jgi:hypothetical protein
VALDGLGAALLYAWPGPIYEGNGECQAVIDERADNKQRDALATILYGGETNDGATHWWVYRKMSSTVHPPLFKRIEFDVNIERRKARIVIPGVLETSARPIRNPRTGAEHRVRINLPDGIEFDLAEIGSGSTKTMASIDLDLKDTYFHFTDFRQSGTGVVHSR